MLATVFASRLTSPWQTGICCQEPQRIAWHKPARPKLCREVTQVSSSVGGHIPCKGHKTACACEALPNDHSCWVVCERRCILDGAHRQVRSQ